MVQISISQIIHLIFAGLWVGSIFSVGFIVPNLIHGKENSIKKLEWFSRLSIVLLFITGGHLAGVRYTFASLFSTFSGYLVILMLILWAVLAIIVEIGTKKARTEETATLFKIASVVGIILLIIGGILSSIG